MWAVAVQVRDPALRRALLPRPRIWHRLVCPLCLRQGYVAAASLGDWRKLRAHHHTAGHVNAPCAHQPVRPPHSLASGRRGLVTLRCRLVCISMGSANLGRSLLLLAAREHGASRIEASIDPHNPPIVAWWTDLGFLLQGSLAVADNLQALERATLAGDSNGADPAQEEASSSTQDRKRSRSASGSATERAPPGPSGVISGVSLQLQQFVQRMTPEALWLQKAHANARAAARAVGTGSRGEASTDTAAAAQDAMARAVDVEAPSGEVDAAGHALHHASAGEALALAGDVQEEHGAATGGQGSAVELGRADPHGQSGIGQRSVGHDDAACGGANQGASQRMDGLDARSALSNRRLPAEHRLSGGAVGPSKPGEEDGRARVRAKPARLEDNCVYLRKECGGKGKHVIKVSADARLPPGFEHSFGRVPTERLRRPYKMLCTVCGDTFYTAFDDAINFDLDAAMAEMTQPA